MNNLKQAVIYWIRLPEHTDIMSEGYVGVTQNFKRRMNEHYRDIKTGKHANPFLVNVANKYGWNNLIKEIVISGDEKFCYNHENDIRPIEKTGWNLSRGGHRGPGRKKGSPGSPGKKRSLEDQMMFELRKKRKEETRLKKIKDKEELSKIRPLCSECKSIPSRSNGTSVHGYQRWHKLCNHCAKKKYRPTEKNDTCIQCGFTCVDSCQMCYVEEKTLCQNCNALRLKNIKKRAELTVDATVDWANLRL